MQKFEIRPIAHVSNSRKEIQDDKWKPIISEITLADDMPDECFDGIEAFSHLEIVYYFHRSTFELKGAEHPRENPEYPRVGIFAQRKKDRPNHLGLTFVRVIEKQGRKLIVSHLDAIDGTPVIDIKPVFAEFLPPDPVRQPDWSHDIVKNYW